MNILHTSDWHLGRMLYGRRRYKEFTCFLTWLHDCICKENIDILLICGDIFDTNTPNNKAQELYYQFLAKLSQSPCKHIIIIAGNHDSPTFLEAPKNLLEFLNIHVIGIPDTEINQYPENHSVTNKEIILLKEDDSVQAIICAVPYLRDKDIRLAEAGENIDDKNKKLITGIQNHYKNIAEKAEEEQKKILEETGKVIPIIALGHLFVAGSTTLQDDGVRDLYVGSLVHVGADTFSEKFDYVALGHLHIAQKVNNNNYIRYCGSPIPMGFGERKNDKILLKLSLNRHNNTHFTKEIHEINIPLFQELIRITGTFKEISNTLKELKTKLEENQEKPVPWIEIEYTETTVTNNLREQLEEIISHTEIEILRIRNNALSAKTLRTSQLIEEQETLQDLSPNDVFAKCLLAFNVPEEEHDELKNSYSEILQALYESDEKAD